MVEVVLNVIIVGLVLIGIGAAVRGLLGPTAVDRVVAVNIVMTQIIMLMLIFSYRGQSYHYIDVALVFVLAAFIATICVLKFLREGKLF